MFGEVRSAPRGMSIAGCRGWNDLVLHEQRPHQMTADGWEEGKRGGESVGRVESRDLQIDFVVNDAE